MIFLQFDPIWVNLAARLGQGQVKQKSNFEMFNCENKDFS